MNFKRLLLRIKADEGFSHKPYQDHLGVWTIGFGKTMIGGHKVTSKTPRIDSNTALEYLEHDLLQACLDASKIFKNLYDLSSVRQEVLVNMAFNLGRTRLSKFKKMIKAVEAMDIDKWVEEMIDSRWYQQVTNRANRLIVAVRQDSWDLT